jgi:hypothetical protein
MAFTNTPLQDSYSSHRIPLLQEIQWRDSGLADKDEDIVNFHFTAVGKFSEKDDRKLLMKRAGTEQKIASVFAGTVRGMHFWADQSKLMYAVDNDLYVVNVNTLASTTLANWCATTSGEVGFTEFLYSTGISKVVVTDGTTLITVDSANTVDTAGPGFPTPHLPNPVFLDGYLFLVKTSTADIYNSTLDLPLVYVGDLINAEIEGDFVSRIAKVNNYLVAFGTRSIEFFWDAGNPTGSPLNRNDTPVKYNNFFGGLAQLGNNIFFIGQDLNGRTDVFVLTDFSIKPLGTPTITRYLNATTDGPTTWSGTVLSYLGNSFYLLRAGTTKTWLCNLGTGHWTRIAYQATSTFNMTHAVKVITSTNTFTWFALSGATSAIYGFNDTLFQDSGTNYTCTIRTPTNDFGTLNRKTMSRLAFNCDRPNTTSLINVSWSDDDYQVFSTPVAIELDQDIACTYRLGSFRQRSFKITYTDNFALRISDIEVDINKGRA